MKNNNSTNESELISDIIEISTSPSKELCELSELIEKNTGEQEVNKEILTALQSVFMKDLEKALKVSETKPDLLEYTEWFLAADSFMLNKFDVIAKALEERSMHVNTRDQELKSIIFEDMNEPEILSDKIMNNLNVGNTVKKSGGIGLLIEMLGQKGHSKMRLENFIEYTNDLVDQKIKDKDIIKLFDKNIEDSMNYVDNRIKSYNNKMKP